MVIEGEKRKFGPREKKLKRRINKRVIRGKFTAGEKTFSDGQKEKKVKKHMDVGLTLCSSRTEKKDQCCQGTKILGLRPGQGNLLLSGKGEGKLCREEGTLSWTRSSSS